VTSGTGQHLATADEPVLVLAQGPATSLPAVLGWVGGLIAAVVVLTVLLLAIRRKFAQDDGPPVTTGSMLEQLRAMRDQGKLSEQEFATARARLSAKVRASAGLEGPPGTNVTPELLRGASATKRRPPVPRPVRPPGPASESGPEAGTSEKPGPSL
jgi:hypothetical protein